MSDDGLFTYHQPALFDLPTGRPKPGTPGSCPNERNTVTFGVAIKTDCALMNVWTNCRQAGHCLAKTRDTPG